jgi:chromosome segregation ATPase
MKSTNLKLHDQIKEVKQELENSKQELKDANYQLERFKDRSKRPSAPMNESEESAKLRKELQFAKSQSSFYKEQVQKKEERIDNLKKGMESLQDENKLYEKQIGQLQEYQEDLI